MNDSLTYQQQQENEWIETMTTNAYEYKTHIHINI